MTNYRMDAEEEALFRSYPYAVYFVQSPSTVSRANSADIRNNNDSACHSPLRSDNLNNAVNPTNPTHEAARLALSRYSSSRGSNNSFLHEKKIAFDLQSHGTATENGETRLMSVGGRMDGDDDEDGEDDEDYYGMGKRGWWWRYLTFRNSSSCAWIALQIGLRLVMSLAVALLVFYIATKPPPPAISIKMAGIGEFGLGEGVDGSGVTTKILTCNCSMDLLIDNKSKLFGLHVHPPFMQMSFAKLPFAVSYGPALYAYSDGSTLFQLNVGTRNKPMYGAGRAMQDLLESGEGLPLMIQVSLRSKFRVVWDLIKPAFHHRAQCFLLLNATANDKKHRHQFYNSSCTVTS